MLYLNLENSYLEDHSFPVLCFELEEKMSHKSKLHICNSESNSRYSNLNFNSFKEYILVILWK